MLRFVLFYFSGQEKEYVQRQFRKLCHERGARNRFSGAQNNIDLQIILKLPGSSTLIVDGINK